MIEVPNLRKQRLDLIQVASALNTVSAKELKGITKHFITREHLGASNVSQKLTMAWMRRVKALVGDIEAVGALHWTYGSPDAVIIDIRLLSY